MTVKIFHLNIQGGRKLEDIIRYLKQKDFDIIQLQEVTDGIMSETGLDTFKEIKDALGYNGVLTKSLQTVKDGKSSYFANATFFKQEFSLEEERVIWLKPYAEYSNPPEDEAEIRDVPRNALALKLSTGKRSFWAINTHLAWGPNPLDEPYKIEQAKILEAFVTELDAPFILSGDFNVTPDSQIVKAFDKLAYNHVVQTGITNTLNPQLHRVTTLFPAGLAVDYLYTSNDLEAKNFMLVSEPLSDHYGLSVEVTI